MFRGFDFTAPAGKTLCVLGPSGVGKTTLLRLILGLLPPGAVTAGRAGDETGAPLMGRAAYMAQTDLLLPWMNVRANVMLGAVLRGEKDRAGARRRADALLAQAGLEGRGDALPGALSGGMRQRTALARTLMEDKPLIVMDEPFANLDAVTRQRLQDQTAAAFAGRTVVLVTHDPLEALRLGHEVAVLGGAPGRVMERMVPEGAPPRALDAPGMAETHARLMRLLAEART
ncbi:MAG: ATP-binding cassette domain-containing protein [Rhodospirillales bacterium]